VNFPTFEEIHRLRQRTDPKATTLLEGIVAGQQARQQTVNLRDAHLRQVMLLSTGMDRSYAAQEMLRLHTDGARRATDRLAKLPGGTRRLRRLAERTLEQKRRRAANATERKNQFLQLEALARRLSREGRADYTPEEAATRAAILRRLGRVS